VPQAPLVIAQVELNESLEPAMRAPPTLLARTIDIKDRVVAATQRVVSVIGDAASSTGRMVGAVLVRKARVMPAQRKRRRHCG